jgi:hypothetical protein
LLVLVLVIEKAGPLLETLPAKGRVKLHPAIRKASKTVDASFTSEWVSSRRMAMTSLYVPG